MKENLISDEIFLLILLVSLIIWFNVLFNSPFGVLFNIPSRYFSTIGWLDRHNFYEMILATSKNPFLRLSYLDTTFSINNLLTYMIFTFQGFLFYDKAHLKAVVKQRINMAFQPFRKNIEITTNQTYQKPSKYTPTLQ